MPRDHYVPVPHFRGSAAPAIVEAPEPVAAPRRRRARMAALRLRSRSQNSPFARAVWLAGIPALCLVMYVGMWTSAVKMGYARNRLGSRIRALEIENNSLQADLLRLQSPARIFREASNMKMERPADIKFVAGPARVARR